MESEKSFVKLLAESKGNVRCFFSKRKAMKYRIEVVKRGKFPEVKKIDFSIFVFAIDKRTWQQLNTTLV